MTQRSLRLLIGLVVLSLAGCASAPTEEDYSGFMKDYAGLKATRDTMGQPLLRTRSPRLTPENYQAVIVEPIQLFPRPKPSDKVSQTTLDEIVDYLNQKLKSALTKRVRVVEEPGPGVVRLRVAVTSVGAQADDLEPYQYIPVALVLTTAARTVEGTPEEAKLFVEAEGTDSVTGERLLAVVRSGTGERLKEAVAGTKEVTLETLKPLIDQWMEDIAIEAPTFVKPL